MKDKLESALRKIGWKLQNRGCGFYYLVDHNGNPTAYRFHYDKLEIIEYREKYNQLSTVFNLRECNIDILPEGGEPDCVSICPKNYPGGEAAFINLYNHSKRN